MTITPDELTENGYVLLDKLEHNELGPFVQLYIKKRTKYAVFYILCNVSLFAYAGYMFVAGSDRSAIDFGDRFAHLSYGIALAFLLVPLHEFIHVLAYKSQGAKNTSYDANLKKFYFMALADKFVANKKEFEVVALAPFVLISSGLLLLLFVVNPNWVLTVIGVLLTHTAMCGGDFGLLSYFEFNQDKFPVTYDDTKNKVSYFYGLTNTSSR